MSNFKQKNGDDYPDAATKHLADAKALMEAPRYDGAAYLAGYVVECALKTLLQAETQRVPKIHPLPVLSHKVTDVCLLADATMSRYVTRVVRSVDEGPIAQWRETMRYRGPSMAQGDAMAWVDEAENVYTDTIANMTLDGVIS